MTTDGLLCLCVPPWGSPRDADPTCPDCEGEGWLIKASEPETERCGAHGEATL
jgi:hypothetical protein